MIDLRVRVGDLELATPIIAASGTYGYGIEYDGLVDWSRLGGIAIKGLSADPSAGHPAPRMVETPAGMLNAIGLQNIGADEFLDRKLPGLRSIRAQGPKLIVNCWGNTTTDFVRIVDRLEGVAEIDVLELNLSCPHKHEWGGVLAADAGVTGKVVAAVRARTRRRLWVKLSPNVTDITEIARAAEGAGADALTVMNTVRGMVIDVESRRPALANGSGGLSGPAIRPIAVYMVWQTVGAVSIPVIGAGGIAAGRDAAEFLMAGAAACEVGTASLYDPAAPARIACELSKVIAGLGETRAADLVGCARPHA